MLNSSALPPNTPPSMSRSQKEQDAASSLVELQQGFSSYLNPMQPNSGMSPPASSPTESNPPADHHISPRQQPHGASASVSPSSQQASRPAAPYQLIMLPSIYRQKESAIRSTLSRSLPAFDTLARRQDQEVRREFAIQNDHHLQQGQVQATPGNQVPLPQTRYHSVYQIHRPQQASSSQARLPPQVSAAQAFAHAQAQAYYLAHARAQTYGHPQQQHSSQSSYCQQPKKQPQQQHHHHQQPVMNHHVRAVEDRRSAQPWPEPNSNRSSKPSRAKNPASMQSSFSIRGDGVRIQRNILHEDQQPATPVPSHQHQTVDNTSPQHQMAVAYQEQQRLAAAHSREAQKQTAQRNVDQQGKPVAFYRPSVTAAQQMYGQQEPLQQHAYRQHQQAYQEAVQWVNQHLKQQQKHSYPLQQHQQAMHQSKETSRHNRELTAQHESLPHRPPPLQQEQRAITISPSTSPETVLTTEADEDEEMYELEDEDESFDEEDDHDDSDPDFQGASKSKRHSGHSSSSGNSNHHHGNNTSSNKKKGKSVKEKPRWTAEMRESLLKAVITYKNLDDMTSFHWSQIGKQVGRSGKACKDQWRRALLPKIQQTFDRCDQDFNTGASSFPASLQPQQQRNNKQ